MVTESGYKQISRKLSCRLKNVTTIPNLFSTSNKYAALPSVTGKPSSSKVDNSTASSPTTRLSLIIVKAKRASSVQYVENIRSILRHRNFNINFNSKDSKFTSTPLHINKKYCTI